MRSVNALTYLATLGAISSVSAGPFNWLHLRDDSATPAESTQAVTASQGNTTSDIAATLTVDGKNVSITELYAYLNGTSSFNASSWLNSTANATHSIVLDLPTEAGIEGSSEETASGEEIELELSYSMEGEAVLSFLNGTQLCTGDDACREIVGEELGMTEAEIQEVEECADDEIEEEWDEDDLDDGSDDDVYCDELEESTSSDSVQATTTSSLAANNWFAGSAPTSTQGVPSSTRSNIYNVAAATGVPSSLATATSTEYLYQTSGAPEGAQATAFPSAAGGSGSNDGDDTTVTETVYVTITVDRIFSGSGQTPTATFSTSGPAATSSSSKASSTSGDSPDSPDSTDTPDSIDSADDGSETGEDCEEEEDTSDALLDEEDDDEWECEETEVESSNSTLVASDYYNVTECASILALNGTDLNSTYADLTAWCVNATASVTPALAEPTSSATETLSSVNSETLSASSSFASATDLPTESASVWASETATEAPSATASATTSFAENQSPDVVTSYVDAYETSYVEPSAVATQSSSAVEGEPTESGSEPAPSAESLSKRLSRGFKKVTNIEHRNSYSFITTATTTAHCVNQVEITPPSLKERTMSSPEMSADTSASETNVPVSLLDTDLYKLTMQNAVLKLFPDSQSEYKFTNRAPDMLFSRRDLEWIRKQVDALSTLRLTPAEREYLEKHCQYFDSEYLDFLENLQLDPANQVKVTFVPQSSTTETDAVPEGKKGPKRQKLDTSEQNGLQKISEPAAPDEKGLIEIKIQGPWKECILYEVPLMSILSEGYFKFDDTDWKDDLEAVEKLAKEKTFRLMTHSQGSLLFSEFGTRRRRSYKVHEAVIKGLIAGDREWVSSEDGKRALSLKKMAAASGLAGTSNVHFAMKFGLRPVGTIAHEWIMAVGAKEDYVTPNIKAMDSWEKVYPPSPTSPLHTMLTDTYTTRTFFQEFTADAERALRWNGLRHDSGSPVMFARQVKQAWESIADVTGKKVEEVLKGKKVIFSDGLDIDGALEIWRTCEALGIDASFGIGTNLTNDFQRASDSSAKSKPLNIVIKLKRIDGLECVKLTDDETKHAGEPDEVSRVEKKLDDTEQA
ncbi:hypothetical protein QFC22_005069 [Naganishia vaughanmartiniae]|uniref:Uncharacterized protein n=1 Tax=Naganishia vaughanmartiniae TaxID=1424756 RepID=A0ACC2WX13_9TREE|nr:hypothetical protein QFC22_005069 [Naganishia vaughanmartiniae]